MKILKTNNTKTNNIKKSVITGVDVSEKMFSQNESV